MVKAQAVDGKNGTVPTAGYLYVSRSSFCGKKSERRKSPGGQKMTIENLLYTFLMVSSKHPSSSSAR